MQWLVDNALRTLWLIIIPVIALALAALFLATSAELHGLEATYPRVVAILIALLAIVSMWRDAVEARREEIASGDPVDEDEPAREGRRGAGLAAGRVLGFIAVLAVTTWLMGVIGFFPAATLLVLGGLVNLGVQAPWKVIAYTVGVVGVAYLLFVEAFEVPFPNPWS